MFKILGLGLIRLGGSELIILRAKKVQVGVVMATYQGGTGTRRVLNT